jgi:hypothetical protein
MKELEISSCNHKGLDNTPYTDDLSYTRVLCPSKSHSCHRHMKNFIEDLDFTYAVFKTKKYILNRRVEKITYCNFLNFEQSTDQFKVIHEKATDLILKSSLSSLLFLLGYRYDPISPLRLFPEEIVHIILTLEYLEILDFEKFSRMYTLDFHTNICQEENQK